MLRLVGLIAIVLFGLACTSESSIVLEGTVVPTPVYKGVFINETFVPVLKQNCPTEAEEEYLDSLEELHIEVMQESSALVRILPFISRYPSDYVMGKTATLSGISEKFDAMSPPNPSLRNIAEHVSIGVDDLDSSIAHITSGRGVTGLVDLESALYHFSEASLASDYYCFVTVD